MEAAILLASSDQLGGGALPKLYQCGQAMLRLDIQSWFESYRRFQSLPPQLTLESS